MRGGSIFFLFISFLFCFPLASQVNTDPARFTFKGEEFFVYPVRGTNLSGVPPTGLQLPDGKYIIFTEYAFSFSGKLKDTTKISGTFSLVQNLPEGKAIFYQYEYKNGSSLAGKSTAVTEGNYIKGLKNGEWITEYEYGARDVKNYRDGLMNGYSYEYSSKGTIIKKLKFKNERLCDTVFYYYPNGGLQLTYDVYDPLYEKEIQPADNFIDKLIESDYTLNIFGSQNSVKSFYIEYGEDGKIKNSIRFTNGKNPEFDTLRYGFNNKLVVKRIDEAHVVETFSDYATENYYSKKIYKNDEVISSLTITNNKKTKSADTVSVDISGLEKINNSSWEILELAIYKNPRSTTKCYLVPAAGYYWEETNNARSFYRPVKIDSVKKSVTIRDTFRYLPTSIYRVREIAFNDTILPSRKMFNENLRMLPGLNAGRITNYYPDFVSYPCNSIAKSGIKDFCKDQLGKETDVRYFKDDRLLNEKIVLTSNKKLSGKMICGVKALYSSKVTPVAWVMELKDGKKNGKQEIAENMRVPVNTDNLFETGNHYRKNGQRYSSAHYKNGVLDGKLNVYESKTYNTGKYNKDSTRVIFSKQTFTWCSTEQEYLSGKLHGQYKTFYETGKPNLIVNFVNGKLNGKYESLNRNGSIAYIFYCANDSLEGTYEAYHAGTYKKNYSARFRKNALESFLVAYSPTSGFPFLEIKVDNDTIISRSLFFENGKLKETILCGEKSSAMFNYKYGLTETYLSSKKSRESYFGDDDLDGSYKLFFANGNILCEGKIEKGVPSVEWKFYNESAQLINIVFFKDTIISFTEKMKPIKFAGRIESFYANGNPRSKGFIKEWESSFDCNTNSEKIKFNIYYTDTWNLKNEKVFDNGNGKGIVYDEKGTMIAEGEFKDYLEEGVWKYYDANGKLNETGTYVNGEKEGLWYSGDLENINFENGACFDLSKGYAMEQYEWSKNTLKFSVDIYKNGVLISSEYFESNMNK